jgi:hypothetical protein
MVFVGSVVDYFDDDARTLEVRSGFAAWIVPRNVRESICCFIFGNIFDYFSAL